VQYARLSPTTLATAGSEASPEGSELGTKSEESLGILASWSAVDQAQEASVDATAVATEVLADPD
jgi:hypothetical protein